MADDTTGATDRGVLGNLPHSRPGRRSAKRDAGRPGATAAAAARGTEQTAPQAAVPPVAKTAPKARPPKQTKRAAGAETPRRQAPPARERQTGGPVGSVLNAAGKVAGTGLRVADGVTRELLRRIPRP